MLLAREFGDKLEVRVVVQHHEVTQFGRDVDSVRDILGDRKYLPGFDPRPDRGASLPALAGHMKLSRGERADWLGDWPQRCARIYLDRDAARADGFVARGGRWGGGETVYQLIIEQGDAQVWVPLFPPSDSRILGDEAYEALGAFDLIPAEVLKRDARSRSQRWLTSQWTGRRRPTWIDVSPEGDRRIRRLPKQQRSDRSVSAAY